MSTETLLAHARGLWEGLAGVPASFSPGCIDVVVSPASQMCPPGWAGVVILQGSAIVTAPSPVAAEIIRSATARLSVVEVAVAERLGEVLPVADVLGPAVLAYTDEELFHPASVGASMIGCAPTEDSTLNELTVSAGAADTAESGLNEITSAAFTVRSGMRIVSAAGYRAWPKHTAHISVLTAPDQRGNGLARLTAGAAVSHALADGLTPQWRARTPQSLRVASALGFHELGIQMSLRLETGDEVELITRG